jgi:hypothetical protein
MRYCVIGYMFATLRSVLREGSRKVPESGDKNTSFGVYREGCCGREILISVGSVFPTCPKHPDRSAKWIQIEIDVAEIVVNKKAQSESAA